jgi:hypothetical protein
MAITTQDVEALSSTGWTQLADSKKQTLLEQAENAVDTLYSGRTSNYPELEGDRDDATMWLAAHMWELAEGGETGSESGTGGSVTYNTVTGEWQSSLSETRYGRFFRDNYLGNEQSTGIVRSY